MYTFRDALIADLPRITEIYNSTIASRLVTADTELVTVESKKPWFENHNSATRPIWMLENEQQEIVGWVSFQSFYGRPAYQGTAEISIYLDPNYRSQGLGKYILQHCIAEAPKMGIKTLLGFIFAHNTPSINLFKKFQFEEWALLPNIANLDGIERSLSIMGLRVG